jgi:hypothetical protein
MSQYYGHYCSLITQEFDEEVREAKAKIEQTPIDRLARDGSAILEASAMMGKTSGNVEQKGAQLSATVRVSPRSLHNDFSSFRAQPGDVIWMRPLRPPLASDKISLPALSNAPALLMYRTQNDDERDEALAEPAVSSFWQRVVEGTDNVNRNLKYYHL